jgi:hypothetical protein
MSDDRRAALVEAGRSAMRAYLDHPSLAPAVPRGLEDAEAARPAPG